MCKQSPSRVKLATWFCCWSKPNGEGRECPPSLSGTGEDPSQQIDVSKLGTDPQQQLGKHAIKSLPG